MSHTIPEIRRRSPMWIYEKNYFFLVRMMPFLCDGQDVKHASSVGNEHIEVEVLEQSRYTHLIELTQLRKQPINLTDALSLKVRIYHDAQLAEVIAYQGYYRLQPKYDYPNNNMFHRDEKRQANYILHDWLSTLTSIYLEVDEDCVLSEV